MSSLSRIWVLALNTYREAVRDKLLYNLLFFAALMIASSILLAQIQIGKDERIYRDVGLGAIAFFGVLIAIFVGINLVYREISTKTVYTMLSKPVRRWEFLVGKYFGLLSLLAVEVAIMSACFLGVLVWKGSPFSMGLVWAIALIYLELALVTAFALFFSCFPSPMLSTLFTLGIYIAGVFAKDIRDFGEVTNSQALGQITRVIYYLLPNFHNFNAIAFAAHGQPISLSLIGMNTLYALLYSAVVLLAAAAAFSGRNLK